MPMPMKTRPHLLPPQRTSCGLTENMDAMTAAKAREKPGICKPSAAACGGSRIGQVRQCSRCRHPFKLQHIFRGNNKQD